MQFKLPELGEGVHEGELIKWKVQIGDSVKYDQPLCEIMTDKATVEIPSAFQGKVAELHVKEGVMVQVGQLMLSFEVAGGAATAAQPAAAKSAPAPGARTDAKPGVGNTKTPDAPIGSGKPGVTAGDTHPATRVLAAPSTRRLAREMGVEMGQIQGSGPHGRVMKDDLHSASSGGSNGASAPATAQRRAPAGGEERIPFRGLRKKISEKMRLSKDKAAHFTYVEECDATALVVLRTQAKEIAAKQDVKLTYLPFIMKAMVAALRRYPILNSTLDEERNEIVLKHYYNIGLSIQTDDGLTAPVVKDVSNKSVIELARDIQNLVERVSPRKISRAARLR
jgi:pyruvate dehydrogenase E2 component (dihydrolipoamide acetyltransferase)